MSMIDHPTWDNVGHFGLNKLKLFANEFQAPLEFHRFSEDQTV